MHVNNSYFYQDISQKLRREIIVKNVTHPLYQYLPREENSDWEVSDVFVVFENTQQCR